MRTRILFNNFPSQFVLRSSVDDSLVTGASPSVQLSVNGGAFAAATNSPTEIGNGLYSILISSTDLLSGYGEVWAYITATGCKDQMVFLFDRVETDFIQQDNVGGVWDVTLFDHVGAGTVGEYLSSLPSASTLNTFASNVAFGVWDTLLTDNELVGSFGMFVKDIPNLTTTNVWAYILEGTKSAAWFMRIFLAGLAGKVSGVSSDHPKFRDLLDTKDRIDATTSADGRTSVTLDGD